MNVQTSRACRIRDFRNLGFPTSDNRVPVRLFLCRSDELRATLRDKTVPEFGSLKVRIALYVLQRIHRLGQKRGGP